MDDRIKYSDSLSLEEIEASMDLNNKITSTKDFLII